MKERNNNIDILKGISSLSVVLIHFSLPGTIGIYLIVISRYSVPFFFFISGYFLLNKHNNISSQRIFNKIKHIIKLLFYSVIFHFIFFVIYNIFLFGLNYNIRQLIINRFIKKKILKFILTNDPFIFSHLWHLLALIYIYIIIYLLLLKNKNILVKEKFLTFLIYFTFLGYIFLGEFSQIKFIKKIIPLGKLSKTIIIRNIFIFRALPHFLLGIFIKLKKIDLKVKTINCIFIFIFGSLMSCIERYLTRKALIFYIGTYLQLSSLIFISLSNNIIKEKGMNFLLYIGQNLSDKIYIYHISIGKIVILFANKLHLTNYIWFKWCLFPIVCSKTILFCFFIKKFELNISIYFNKIIILMFIFIYFLKLF